MRASGRGAASAGRRRRLPPRGGDGAGRRSGGQTVGRVLRPGAVDRWGRRSGEEVVQWTESPNGEVRWGPQPGFSNPAGGIPKVDCRWGPLVIERGKVENPENWKNGV